MADMDYWLGRKYAILGEQAAGQAAKDYAAAQAMPTQAQADAQRAAAAAAGVDVDRERVQSQNRIGMAQVGIEGQKVEAQRPLWRSQAGYYDAQAGELKPNIPTGYFFPPQGGGQAAQGGGQAAPAGQGGAQGMITRPQSAVKGGMLDNITNWRDGLWR